MENLEAIHIVHQLSKTPGKPDLLVSYGQKIFTILPGDFYAIRVSVGSSTILWIEWRSLPKVVSSLAIA